MIRTRTFDSREIKPPEGVLIMGYKMGGTPVICRWVYGTWGAHIHIVRWRHLTFFERIKVWLGIVRPYTHLGGSGL